MGCCYWTVPNMLVQARLCVHQGNVKCAYSWWLLTVYFNFYIFIFLGQKFTISDTKRNFWATLVCFISAIPNNSLMNTIYINLGFTSVNNFQQLRKSWSGWGQFFPVWLCNQPNLAWHVGLFFGNKRNAFRLSGWNHRNSAFAFWQGCWNLAECVG